MCRVSVSCQIALALENCIAVLTVKPRVRSSVSSWRVSCLNAASSYPGDTVVLFGTIPNGGASECLATVTKSIHLRHVGLQRFGSMLLWEGTFDIELEPFVSLATPRCHHKQTYDDVKSDAGRGKPWFRILGLNQASLPPKREYSLLQGYVAALRHNFDLLFPD